MMTPLAAPEPATLAQILPDGSLPGGSGAGRLGFELAAVPYTAAWTWAGPDAGWDALVGALPGGDLVQSTRWAASRVRLGFRAWRLVVAGPDGQMVGGCMVYATRLLPGCWIASVPRGPLVFGGGAGTAAVVRGLRLMARRLGIRLLAVQPPEGAAAVERALAEEGFRPGGPAIAPEATIRLAVRRTDAELLAGMSRRRRQNIRKGLLAGFEVREEGDPETFHRLHRATAARQGFSPVSLANLEAQHAMLAPVGGCAALVARYRGVPVAGRWLTRFGGTVTSKLAGWDARLPVPAHANEAVQWAALLWARREGAETYDFGGFDRTAGEALLGRQEPPDGFPDSPNRFKTGFGGTLVLLPRARFCLPDPLLDGAFGGLAARLLASAPARRVSQWLRNG
ncbi:MAG TPA: GNAT family N-acetyltransferase [Azospirillaceae bacterium]|nr:GNAT family N-acetyltransferase [Azospirillaceae bacterium]